MDNVAKILQYAPKGIELYSNIYGPVTFEYVKAGKIYFKYTDKRNQKVHKGYVYEYGNACFDTGEVNLRISRNKDWDSWQNILLPTSLGYVIMCTTNSPSYSYRLKIHGYLIARRSNGDMDLFDCNGMCYNRKDNGFIWTEWRYASPEETEHYFEELRKSGQHYEPKSQRIVRYNPKDLEAAFKCGDIIRNKFTGLKLLVTGVNTAKLVYETKEGTYLAFNNDQWEKSQNK